MVSEREDETNLMLIYEYKAELKYIKVLLIGNDSVLLLL